MRKRAGALAPPEGEAGFRTLVDGIPGAVYRREAAPPWRFAYVSDAIEAIVGYRAQDLVEPGGSADAILPVPDDLRATTDAVRLAVSAGQPFGLDYRVRHADGTTRWIADRGRPGRDASGRLTWIDGVLFDVTERRQAEVRGLAESERVQRELIQERTLLETLLDKSPDHIYFKDLESRFTRISGTMATSLGLADPSLAIGKTDFDFFTEEQAHSAFDDEREIMRAGQPVGDL